MGHLISILVYGWFAFSHGDLDLRIASLTADIQQYPDSLSLYQLRGDLHVLHQEYELALHDYAHCLQHAHATPGVFLGMSKVHCAFEGQDSSLHYANLALRHQQEFHGAMEWKARLLLLMQKPCEAAVVYDQLLDIAADPSPALYIDAGRAWNTCSGQQADPHAIAILLEGLSHLGSILVLQKELVHLYQQNGKYPLALEIQNQIVEQATQKTKPLMTRAAIHVSMGNNAAAKTDLELALLTLDQLPTHRSGTPAMKAIRENILSLLKALPQ